MESTLVALLSANVDRPWPCKPGHVLGGETDLRAPRDVHPVFYGCFDWHSAVHSHWALARLARAHPAARWAKGVVETLAARLSPAALAAEADYLAAHPSFEQPYGSAWLLTLCGELERTPALAGRAGALAELARDRLRGWLARLPGPIRSGQHDQTAFAMGLAHDWATAAGDGELQRFLGERARAFYLADVDVPVAYEPSAHDFLSPALSEAELMARVLDRAELGPWLQRFVPRLALTPVATVDPGDGKLAHASGLNLSRAWMAARVAAALEPGPLRARFDVCATSHAASAWTPVSEPPYAESHWLPTFVVYHRLSAIS